MPSTYIPEHHRLVRYVPLSKLATDEDGNVNGVLGIAFRLRDDEEYLSASWVEFFDGLPVEQFKKCVETIRNSDIKVGGKSAFAYSKVSRIKEVCLSKGRKLRVIHEPEEDNVAHVAVRYWPKDDEQLLNLMSEDNAWGQ